MGTFEEVGMMPELIRAVEDMGWVLPTPVQAEAVPLILGGGDVMAAAETGSGKTGAFALPVLQVVHEAQRAKERRDGGGGGADGGAASGVPALPPVELSQDDRDAVISIQGGTLCQSRAERAWGGVRATVGAYAGKVFFEVLVRDEGLCRVGWATLAASLDLGTDKHGFGFGGTGMKSHQRQFESYGRPYGKGDVVGCCLDTQGDSVSFSVNGDSLGQAFALPQHLQGQALYPAITLKNAEVEVNFGGTPFKHAPPPGYSGLAAAPPEWLASAEAAAAAAAAGAGAGAAGGRPLCIVLEPSRDLAEQTHQCIAGFARHLTCPAVRTVLLVGGLDAGAQQRQLAQGADVVVGTPARVLDFVEGGKLRVDQVRFFVLDEADRLTDSAGDVLKLFRRLPKGGEGAARLQVLMFSATLHTPEVKALSAQLCCHPTLVDLKGHEAVPDTVDHVIVWVDPSEDRSWLQTTPKVWTDRCHALDAIGPEVATREAGSEAVKRLKPRVLQRLIDALRMEQAIIFCRTNHDCDNLERFLASLSGTKPGFQGKKESGPENPYSCVVLAGGRPMEERRQALQAFKEGDVRFLVSTDVGARGIDVSGLPYVINMTLPDKPEDYIHRVGRVGRASALGLAVSLVSKVPEKVWYCTTKGAKPWLEPDATNTRTNDQGGHTIWYDEKALLLGVERRLGGKPIEALGPDLALPPRVAARMAGQDGTYGQQRACASGTAGEARARLEAIRQNVEVLTAVETAAQASFLNLKRKWGAASMVE